MGWRGFAKRERFLTEFAAPSLPQRRPRHLPARTALAAPRTIFRACPPWRAPRQPSPTGSCQAAGEGGGRRGRGQEREEEEEVEEEEKEEEEGAQQDEGGSGREADSGIRMMGEEESAARDP